MGHRPGPGIMHMTCSRPLAQGRFQWGFSCGSVTQRVLSGVIYLPWPGCWETSVFLALCMEVGWWEVRDAWGWVCNAGGCVKYLGWRLTECLWLHLGKGRVQLYLRQFLHQTEQFSNSLNPEGPVFPFPGTICCCLCRAKGPHLRFTCCLKRALPFIKGFSFRYRTVLQTSSEVEKQRGLTVALFAEPWVCPANTWLTGLASWLELTACVCLKCCSNLLFLWAEERFLTLLA